ncbi:MAG: Fe(3+) dicitrate transport protein [Bacteroidia bacterium]|jgi:Fe(3+) dicitrate transport protein
MNFPKSYIVYRTSLILLFFLLNFPLLAQFQLSGTIVNSEDDKPIAGAEVFNAQTKEIYITNSNGKFTSEKLKNGSYDLTIFAFGFESMQQNVMVGDSNLQLKYTLNKLETELSEVIVSEKREEIYALKRLRPVEGTAIYAGKKTEVVLMANIVGNVSSNNSRQIYAQVAGLNIYEDCSAGLQLNLGGRGLDPNRSANFNTRQNGYDISADVLGYPESYYAPPAEALGEIQVIRGAASLQYGTQFGGLINFKFKKPNPNKKVELTSRQSVGSFGLYTNFTSLSGTVGKFSYYTYYNYKNGECFTCNSEFESDNFYTHFGYQISDKSKLELEFTYLNYLAQQAGGISDAQFYEDASFSNRERNWFDVDWKLLSLKFLHEFSSSTELSVNLFGLKASRKAVGFRSNRVNQPDPDGVRDLIIGDFQNWGAETRLLTRYKLFNQDAVFLIGSKYYQSANSAIQGPGSSGSDANFDIDTTQTATYANQSDFDFPNLNVSLFGENIFYLNDMLSITPGFRFEYIRTESVGSYQEIATDGIGQVIFSDTIPDNRIFDRSFVLLGVGLSYEASENAELYANLSQNYRSVTFNDIRVAQPGFVIDPNITDESGFTADLGIRGNYKGNLSYDVGIFALAYKNRLGFVNKENPTSLTAERERGNVGDAYMVGFESLLDWNVKGTFFAEKAELKLNLFANTSITKSEYISSERNGVEGNEVEFVPFLNLKTGARFGYKNLLGSVQFTHLSSQFTDATNAPQDKIDNLRGIRGEIPAYSIMDLSLSYTYKSARLESGINNLLNRNYFTRRATGYPGPGIIPSSPRTWYVALQVKI